MTKLADPELLERLAWRYAVKRFDPARRINAEDLSTLEQALTLSPSSYGLQPYHFLIIDDAGLRRELSAASFGQPQIVEASHLVVIAIRKNLDAAYIDHYIARTAQVRGVTTNSLAGFRKAMVGDLIEGPRHAWIDQWAARQAYIALGNLLTSAAVLGIDGCPMEGFEPAKYDQILGLPAQGLGAVVLCALGYRNADDRHAYDPKVRFPVAELVEHR